MYSAWIAFGGASLLIALAACRSEIPSVQSGAGAVSTEGGATRELHDAARQRIWRLTQTGLALENEASGETQIVALPNWLWAHAEYAGCLPDLALGRTGEVVVTSNITPTLWRVDPQTLAVTERTLWLNAEYGKEVGFTGLVYSPREDVYFAVSALHGSLWRIDPQLRKAQMLMLQEPLRGACSVRLRARAERVERLTGLCIGTESGTRNLVLAPDQRSAYARPQPCVEGPNGADVAFAR
jgi:hypothetical protein